MIKKTVTIFFTIMLFYSNVYAMGTNLNREKIDGLILNKSNIEPFECLARGGTLYKFSDDYEEAWNSNKGDFLPNEEDLDVGIDQNNWDGGFCFLRSFIYFDINLPENAIITGASLKLYVKEVHLSPYNHFNIRIQSGIPGHPHDILEKEDFNRNYYSGNGGHKWAEDFDENQYNEISLNSDGVKWIKKEGYTKFCLRTNQEINGHNSWLDDFIIFSSGDSSKPPKLEIEYETMDIVKPKNYIYINNKRARPFSSPVILGPIDIEVDMPDSDKVDGVEFYIDDKYIDTDYRSDYTCYWNEKVIKSNAEIDIRAIDNNDESIAKDTKNVLLYFNPSPDITCGYRCQETNGLGESYLVSVDTLISNQKLEEIKNLFDEELEAGAKPSEIVFRYVIDFGDNSKQKIITTEEPSCSVSHNYKNKKNSVASSEISVIFKLDLDCDGDHEEVIYSFSGKEEKVKDRSVKFGFSRYVDDTNPMIRIIERVIRTIF